MADALVLGGAVAKGAFAAGAVAELQQRLPLDLRRIVGTSSGALSAAFLSATHGDAERLVSLWLDRATWRMLAPDACTLASLRGFSSGKRVRELVETELPRTTRPGVPLRIVVTDLAGVRTTIGADAATTFERVCVFDAPSFVGTERDAIVEAVLGSAAFPFLFAPQGSRMDGGAVDNTSIHHALEDAREVDHIFVIAPYPRVLEANDVPELRGLDLAMHLAEVLIHERLSRDLREAHAINRALEALPASAGERYEAVLEVLGWRGRKVVEIVDIRPPRRLRGSPFDAFFDRKLREEYVAVGRAAAATALKRRSLRIACKVEGPLVAA